MKIAVPLCLARYYHQMFAAGRNALWIHIWALRPRRHSRRRSFCASLTLARRSWCWAPGCAVIFFAGISLRVDGLAGLC